MRVNLLVLTGLLSLSVAAPTSLQERGACSSACQQEWHSVQNCNNGGKCRGGKDFKQAQYDSCCDYHSKVKRADEIPDPKSIVPVLTSIVSPWPVHTDNRNPSVYLPPKTHVPVATTPVPTALEKRKDPCTPACQKQWDTLQDCRAHTTCGGGWLDAEFKAAYDSCCQMNGGGAKFMARKSPKPAVAHYSVRTPAVGVKKRGFGNWIKDTWTNMWNKAPSAPSVA